MVGAVVSAVVQVLGAALVCLAVGMLAGLWWGVLLAGLIVLVGGTLAEIAKPPAPGYGRGVSHDGGG